MQNFPNSPVPLHPGFSRAGSVVGSPYQHHPSDLQISPRNSEDYATRQQAQPNLQSHGQHLRSQQHLLHAPPIHGYGSRRAAGELTQGNTHSGGGNSYRKDSVDYYFSVSGRERSRRGGAAYGAGFRYSNVDGHTPHQYQHLSGSGSSSGMISPYSMDYGSGSASAVGSSNSSGAGCFSPSQQYSLAHTASVQSGAQMHQLQHGQRYQGLHQGQHQRTYPISGNRIPPQFGNYAPLNATTDSTGMYNSPPQRYGTSSSSTDAKMNNSPTQSNPNTHTSSSASNSCENMGQSYTSSAYSPQSQSLHKHAPHSQRPSQLSTGAGHDPSLKMQHQGHLHTKLPHSSVSSSPALPSHPSQDIAKSPLHSQSQQARIHQNFSPISNPSPGPSAVQSPSCSSSSSPLMGSSEGNNAVIHLQPSSNPSVSNARSSQSHGRLLQAVPQLSPTPNSNSSISSCGSGVGTKAAVLNHGAGVGHAAMSQNRMRRGLRGGPGEDGSLYPHDKLLQDPGLNSLNALTSQVENLPNTVQHMLLTDTVLPLKKGRDSAHHLQVQQGSQSFLGNQNKSGNSSASGQTSVNKESSEMLEAKGDQQVECERNRQASGTSNESEPQSYPSSQSQMPSEARQQVLDLQVNTGVFSTGSKQLSQANTPETLTPSSSSPPSSVHASAEPSPKQPVYPPAPPSPIHSANPNCVAEKYLHNDDDDSVTKGCKIKMIKGEESEVENADHSCDRENSENKRSVPPAKDEAKSDAKEFESQSKNENVSEQHNFGGVGVIVSARSEGNTESSKHTGARSPRYGVSHYSNKHSKPGDQLDVNVLRETRNHNGEGEMCMEKYVSQYDISPKQEFGQNPQPSIQSHPGSFKYSNPDIHYKAAKTRGKLGLGSSMGTNRCQNYHQLEASYGSIGRKEIGVFGMEGGRAIVSRSQDNSSQFHQSFPSLLQEVLQGHHLDRRYGRPDQTSSVHQQSQDTSQYRYQTRLPYSMDENLSSHAMGSQTLISGLNVKFRQMASGKPPNSSQNQGPDNDIVLGPSHPSWDSEAHKPNVTHGISLEQDKTSLSPSQSSHMEQCLDLTTGVPSKHINLADYSLQHRKPPRYGTSSSAVEQLLLQEAEPLACGVGPICHTQSQTSSGRRSVICDVSPSRRTTPERERGHSGTSGPSVIQQPFSSSGSNEQEGKEEIKVKKAQKKEDSSKSETAGQDTDGYCSMPPSKECSKPLHPLVDVDFDIEKTNSAKGKSEATSNLPYLLQMSSNPLSSPPRHQSFSQAVDGFRAYGFSDTVDGPKIISHPRPHQPFHTVSAYSKTTPSTNKLQAFPQSLPPHERHDWTPDRQRLRGIDRHIPQRLSEQKGKSQASSDILPSQHHQSRQHPYPSSHFEMKMWDTYPEREGAGQPTTVPHEHVGSRPVTNAVPKPGEDGISVKSADDTAKSFHSLAPVDAVSPAEQPGKTSQGIHQGQRATKTGTLTETNPLIMRRRVRSFISPIPAKRQHQDVPGQRPGSAYHSPLSQSHSDSKLATNNGSGSTDTQTKLSSPKTQYSISSANSPSQPKAKFLPPRKGHGLKLEAIVRKITPSVKKNDFNNSHVESNFSEVSHYASDIPDPEGGTSFSSVSQGEEACLSYLDDSHTLDDLMPYRVVEDAFSCDSQTLKLGATASSTNALRSLPKDFDFGLGAAGSSGSLGESDKDDFTLLGPLPPAPPLPCPVQGSPPSSSALSDIQQFTNTYQQLETRRGEQSAANLLKQKLEETGMGFDDYPGGDYYGTTTGHSQSPGHHLLSRASRHQMTSLRSTSSDPKTSENNVPKGYFPSGKKKGRPVGSVNKQKRAQAQIQNTAASIPVDSLPSPTAEPQSVPIPDTASEMPQVSTPPDQKPCPSLSPPAQTQVVKVDVESEETQPELDVKPVRHRPKKGKEDNETSGDQRRRRRGMASKEKLDTQASSRGNISPCGILSDARSNLFTPYIHVEKKIAEIGAVCTIINADDEKLKGGDKAGHLAVDGPLNFPLSSQLVRKEKENERTKENWVSEPVDSALQSGKTLPTSEYVLPGPVISETGHTGRLLCCLCQKWANYKHLGDLYGPFYPAEYAAKLPKNQPQVRQTSSNHGASTTGFSMTSVPIETTPQDTRLLDSQNIKSSADSDRTVSQATNSASPATTVGPVSPRMGEEMPFQDVKMSSSTSKVTAHTWDLAGELTSGLGTSKAQELDGEIVLKQLHVENTQQRPQHRKLTSHPRFKRRHKSNEDLPRTVPINSKASLPFQPPPPSLDSLDPMAQMAQLPLVPLDPEELWVHEGCIVWTSGVYLVNGRLYGLQEALDGARDTSCSHCEMVGSTLGCYSKGCTLSYHYLCAIEADCSLNEDNFSLRCPKHKSFHLSSKCILIEEGSDIKRSMAWSGVSGAVGARTSAPSDRRECVSSDSLAVLERCDQTLCCASLQQRLCPAGRQPWTQSSDTFSKEH